MLDHLSALDVAGRLGLAVAMGVFMGLAFEGIYKREQHDSPGGIRTFPMLATLGAMLFLLDQRSLLPFIAGIGAVAIWLYAHIQRAANAANERPSLMIPTANLLAYAFGPLALTQPPWITVAAAVTAVLLLEGRERLHRLVLQVAPDEVFTLGKFLILVGIVLPLVPNHPIVAWTPISPFQVWLALVAISTLSYASYLLQRYLPTRSGALLPAILGGVYSSTATTVTLARRQRQAAAPQSDIAVGIVVASAMMYLRIDVVVAMFNLALARVLMPPLLICMEEPELGLHPDALQLVAEVLRDAADRSQLIVTTHSEALIDALSGRPDAVVVCERDFDNATSFQRLSREGLGLWLERYRLGELWRKGQIGGNRW